MALPLAKYGIKCPFKSSTYFAGMSHVSVIISKSYVLLLIAALNRGEVDARLGRSTFVNKQDMISFLVG